MWRWRWRWRWRVVGRGGSERVRGRHTVEELHSFMLEQNSRIHSPSDPSSLPPSILHPSIHPPTITLHKLQASSLSTLPSFLPKIPRDRTGSSGRVRGTKKVCIYASMHLGIPSLHATRLRSPAQSPSQCTDMGPPPRPSRAQGPCPVLHADPARCAGEPLHITVCERAM